MVSSQFDSIYSVHSRNFNLDTKKLSAELESFDPSSSAVHEDSRIKNKIIIPPRTNGVRRDSLSASLSELTEVTETELSEDVDHSGDEYHDVESRPTRIMPIRAAATKGKGKSHPTTQTKLPFSPKKLRSRPVRQFITESEDELAGYAEEDIIEVIPARRSTRDRKSARTNLADDYVDETSDNETDNEAYLETSKKSGKSKVAAKTQKRIRRGPVSRPAYGIFRSVQDLEFDAYGEENTELLRAHRDVCEKCHRAPAHVQLEKSKKSRKKAREGDEFETEEDAIQSLGGWVRWYDQLNESYVNTHYRTTASGVQLPFIGVALQRPRRMKLSVPRVRVIKRNGRASSQMVMMVTSLLTASFRTARSLISCRLRNSCAPAA